MSSPNFRTKSQTSKNKENSTTSKRQRNHSPPFHRPSPRHGDSLEHAWNNDKNTTRLARRLGTGEANGSDACRAPAAGVHGRLCPGRPAADVRWSRVRRRPWPARRWRTQPQRRQRCQWCQRCQWWRGRITTYTIPCSTCIGIGINTVRKGRNRERDWS